LRFKDGHIEARSSQGVVFASKSYHIPHVTPRLWMVLFMASQLDKMIAKVTLEAASPDPAKMMAAAAEVAPHLTPGDVAKLAERWYPKISSKAAGAPQFRDSWPRAWFEALVEVLCQKGALGLAPLYELLERDGATYHEMVVLRLLRLAAAGVGRADILARLKARLPTLHQTQVGASVRAVVDWSERDPQPLELLRPMAKLKVKNAEGATVGTYIKEYEADLALMLARRSPKNAGDPLNEVIVSVAVLGQEPDRFRGQAGEVARALGAGAASQLVERIKNPDLPTLQSRIPPTISNHEAIWCRAIVEILSHLGAEAIPAVRSFLDDDDAYLRELSLRLLCLLAARSGANDRDVIVALLRERLPAFHYSDVRDTVSRLMQDARAKPILMEVLDVVGDVKVKNYGNRRITVREIVQAVYVPPPTAKPCSNPANEAACKDFSERFGAAVVAKDFAAVHRMLCAALRKKFTAKKLDALVATESKHSGPPDAFEFGDNNTTAAELREGRHEFPPLPAHVTDANFRRWCCLQFLPVEESDSDACFAWWMAVIEEDRALKVGFFHILDAD
jgi:hypothetical protein